jgi:hypothetical protein
MRPWFLNSASIWMNKNEGAAKTKVEQDPHLPCLLDISQDM